MLVKPCLLKPLSSKPATLNKPWALGPTIPHADKISIHPQLQTRTARPTYPKPKTLNLGGLAGRSRAALNQLPFLEMPLFKAEPLCSSLLERPLIMGFESPTLEP